MTGNIRTNWHKLVDAAKAGRIAIASSREVAVPIGELKNGSFDQSDFCKLIDDATHLPRFVVDETLCKMILTNDSFKSISDMKELDLLSLPFPQCVIEYSSGGGRFHVLLSEERQADDLSWGALPMFLYDEGDKEPWLTTYGGVLALRMVSASTNDPAHQGINWQLGVTGTSANFLTANKNNREFLSQFLEGAGMWAVRRSGCALVIAVILLFTIGIKQEKVEVKAKVNRDRIIRGKSPIPTHTVLRLHHYETASGEKRAYNERAPVEVYIRRAHKRRVVVGVGRLGREWRLIPATVVGYLPDGRKPEMAEVLATRAIKPYLVKA